MKNKLLIACVLLAMTSLEAKTEKEFVGNPEQATKAQEVKQTQEAKSAALQKKSGEVKRSIYKAR